VRSAFLLQQFAFRLDRKWRVGILVFDGVKLLDVAGPSEVFTEANRFGGDYEVVLYSADGREVASSTGMRIGVHGAAAGSGPLELAVVAGGDVFPAYPVSPELAGAARMLAGRARRTTSICTGAFIVAAHRAARWPQGHHALAARQNPSPRVPGDRGGAGRDLRGRRAGDVLRRGQRGHRPGPGAGRTRPRRRAGPGRRPLAGGIPAASGRAVAILAVLRAALPRTSPLRQPCDTVAASPAGDYSLARLAAMASLSPRHLTMLFREELGTTPARYVELIRFDTAKDLLDAGHSVTDTALRSGYGSTETLRRAFIQHLGVSPRAYQQRFHSAIRN
jgi:transcriptional regulator GlxA family with amidase domain